MTDQRSLNKQSSAEEALAKPSGQWMNLDEAADLLDISIITMRRHAKKGNYKFRKLGKSRNAKIQVFVDANVIQQSEAARVSAEGFEDVLEPEELDITDWEPAESAQVKPMQETLSWMQDTLNDKDALIQELNEKLMGATFRNGYLESQLGTYREQIKLITQTKEFQQVQSTIEKPVTNQTVSEELLINQSVWQKLAGWFKSGS